MTGTKTTRKGETMRRNLGTIVSGNEHTVGEIRSYGSWTVEKRASKYVATIGNAMKIEAESLVKVLNRIDEAGKDA